MPNKDDVSMLFADMMERFHAVMERHGMGVPGFHEDLENFRDPDAAKRKADEEKKAAEDRDRATDKAEAKKSSGSGGSSPEMGGNASDDGKDVSCHAADVVSVTVAGGATPTKPAVPPAATKV